MQAEKTYNCKKKDRNVGASLSGFFFLIFEQLMKHTHPMGNSCQKVVKYKQNSFTN